MYQPCTQKNGYNTDQSWETEEAWWEGFWETNKRGHQIPTLLPLGYCEQHRKPGCHE